MSHLSDKPLGLVKLQKELRIAQTDVVAWKDAYNELWVKYEELREELKLAYKNLAKKGKK